MNKALAWILSFTKVGKAVTPIQKALSGKKTYLSGIALIVPALATIIIKFSDMGMAYLMELPKTEEFRTLMEGIGLMTIRAAITKAADPLKDPNVPA